MATEEDKQFYKEHRHEDRGQRNDMDPGRGSR